MSVFNNIICTLKNTGKFHLFFFSVVFLLQACGGEEDNSTTEAEVIVISGSAVKGPLAKATVTIYEIDLTQANYRGAIVASGKTNDSAHINELSIPLDSLGPYLVEFTSTGDTIDITTNKAPIIETLRTIISAEMLVNGDSVYASPLTTMATDIAFFKSDPNKTNPLAITASASTVVSVFGFGMSPTINIFSTPPLINAETITPSHHKDAAEYRTAIEALSALAFKLGNEVSPKKVTAEEMLAELTADLTDDNMVTGIINGLQSEIIDVAVVTAINSLNPATLPILDSDDGTGTGTPFLVEDVEKILVAEKDTTGGKNIETIELEDGSITFTPVPVKTEKDSDGDTIMDSMDNCPNKANTDQADSNGNSVGDVCDAPPKVNDDTGGMVDEGGILDTGTKSVLTNDTDNEGDSLTAIIVTPPAFAADFTLNANGTYVYTHDGSKTTTDSFTYRANDGTSDSANTATVTITIIPAPIVNILPVAVNDAITVVSGATVTELTDSAISPAPDTVLYNDIDADGDTLTAIEVTKPKNGTLVLNSDGTFSYTHDGGTSTSDNFTYRVNDGTGDSVATATVIITITVIANTPPVANDNSITVAEGGTVSKLVGGQNKVLFNDTDAEGNNLTAILLVTQHPDPAFSSNFVLNADGTFSYTHDGSETISDSFSYWANDGFNKSNLATVTINITPVNDTPTAVADTAMIIEDSASNPVIGNILLNDEDPDNDVVDYLVSTVNTVAVIANTPLDTTLTYGVLTVNVDGTYSYLLDNTNAAVDALSNGQTLTETINYTMSDGALTSSSSTLTITINGVTDAGPVVDISGVWEISSTITSQSPANCETGITPAGSPIDLTSTSFVTITQNGTILDVKSHLGVTFTGSINSGAFTLSAELIRKVADFSQPGVDSAARRNWTETLSVTGTGISQTSLTGTIDTTRIIAGVANSTCNFKETYTASYIYKHTGTEQYSGIYGEEIWNEAISNSVTNGPKETFSTQSSSTIEFEINGSNINFYLPELKNLLDNSNKTVVFTNATYDPLNGYFTATADFDLKIDRNADLTVEENIIGTRTLSGIFLRSPANNGANGQPLAAMSLIGYHRVYLGDKAQGIAADEVTISGEESYLRRLTMAGQTRTALYENADLTTSSQIKVGVTNPPLKKVSTNSILYVEVIDPAAVAPNPSVLCSAPYRNDGVTNGRYHENSNHPEPNFEALNFRSTVYGDVNCFTTPKATDGQVVKVQIRDTGSDGLRDGEPGANVVDSVTVIDANYPVEVYTPAFTEVTPLSTINIHGASIAGNTTGAVIPLLGYFNFTKNVTVKWNGHAEVSVNGSYQLRHRNLQDATVFRYLTNSTTTWVSIPPNSLTSGDTLQVVALNKTAGTGKIAQAISRNIVISSGVTGQFDFNLSTITPVEYKTFSVSLSQVDGVVQCSVVAANATAVPNPSLSCGVAGNTVNFTTDIVELTMTDVAGNLNVGIVGNKFKLLLHFNATATPSSNQAIVTSPTGVGGIPVDAVAPFTTTATVVNQ